MEWKMRNTMVLSILVAMIITIVYILYNLYKINIFYDVLTGGKKTNEKIILESKDSAGITVDADTSGDTNTSSFIKLSQNKKLINALISLVAQAGKDGLGDTYGGTLLNALMVANKNGALQLGTGSHVRATIMPNGDVGINTASPLSRFHVNGRLQTSRHGICGTYDSRQVQQLWSIGQQYNINTSDNNFGHVYGSVYAHTNVGTSGWKKPIPGWGHQICYVTSGSRRAVISVTSGHMWLHGNLGLGVEAPTQKLDVSGNMKSNGAMIGRVRSANRGECHLFSNGANEVSEIMFGHNSRVDSNVRWAISDRGLSSQAMYIYEGPAHAGSWAARMCFRKGGSIGVNTTNPLSLFHVNGRLQTSRHGICGTYNSSQVQQLWSIGQQYNINTSANDFGNVYGSVYAHTNAGTSGWKKPIPGWGHQVCYVTNGNRRAVISVTSGHMWLHGNLGLGTTAPTQKLDVNGNIKSNRLITGTTTYNPGGLITSANSYRINTRNGYVDIGPANTGFVHFLTNRPAFYFNKRVCTNGHVYPYQANFDLGMSAARYRWRNGYIRNVFSENTSTNVLKIINGEITYIDQTTTVVGGTPIVLIPAGLKFDIKGSTVARLTDDGDLGLGINKPAAKIHLYSNNTTKNEVGRIESARSAGLELFGDRNRTTNSDGCAYIQMSHSGLTTGMVRSVISTIRKTGQDGTGGTCSGTTANSMLICNKASGALHLATNNHVNMTIHTGGKINVHNMIGVRQIPAYGVDLVNSWLDQGTCRAYRFTTHSDARIKSNKRVLEHGLDTILKLNPQRFFQHNSETDVDGNLIILPEGHENIGLIAQEVDEIVPEIVSKPNDLEKDLYSLDYVKIVPILINAVHELDAECKELRQTKLDQEQEIDKLRGYISSLYVDIQSIKVKIGLPVD